MYPNDRISRPSAEGPRLHRDLLAGLAALLVYLGTLSSSVGWYDSAELVAAAVRLGVPHPPGYPLYCLLAHGFTWLPLPPALAVNLFSAVCGASCVAITHRILALLGAGRGGALLGAGLLASTPLFWAQCLVAEVYAPGLVCIALVWLLLLEGRVRSDPRWGVLAAGVAGLGLGAHLFLATCGLGFAALCLWGARGGHLLRRAGASLMATLAGGAVFAYLPLRDGADPSLNPRDLTDPAQLWWFVSGGNYGSLFADPPLMGRLGEIGEMLRGELGIPAVLLCVLGFVGLARRRPEVLLAFFLAAFGNLAVFYDYMTHDWQVFLLPTILLLSLLAGLGAGTLAGLSGQRRVRDAVLSLAVLGLVGLRVHAAWTEQDRSTDRSAEAWLDEMVESLPEDAVLLQFYSPEEWRYDTVFSHYGQGVLHLRPDVQMLPKPSLSEVSTLLAEGRAVFAYAPLPRFAGQLRLEAQGPAWRVVGTLP